MQYFTLMKHNKKDAKDLDARRQTLDIRKIDARRQTLDVGRNLCTTLRTCLLLTKRVP